MPNLSFKLPFVRSHAARTAVCGVFSHQNHLVLTISYYIMLERYQTTQFFKIGTI